MATTDQKAYRQLRHAAANLREDCDNYNSTTERALANLIYSVANYVEFGPTYAPQVAGNCDRVKGILADKPQPRRETLQSLATDPEPTPGEFAEALYREAANEEDKRQATVTVESLQTLDNGATVIDHKVVGPEQRTYVLAAWKKGHKTEYVTWELVDGATINGHYHVDLVHAVEEFANRGW